MKIVIVDMDGTLSDATHRSHLAQSGQWDEFHSASKDDPVREAVADFCRVCGHEFELIILTGRNEKFRNQTNEWLKAMGLASCFSQLLMRPDDDFRPDIEMKIALLEDFFGSKESVLEEVSFCLDDRDKVVEGFRDYGLDCWQVKQGDY